MGNETTISIVIFSFIYIPILLLFTFMPYAMRRTESFGVSIPAKSFSDPYLKALRKKYVGSMAVLGLVILSGFILLSLQLPSSTIEYVATAGIIVTIIASFLVYLRFHFLMKSWKEKQGWHEETKNNRVVVDTRFRKQPLTYTNHWFWLAGVIWGVTLGLSIVQYDRVPELIPINFDLQGNVNHWVDKTWWSVLSLPVIQLVLIGLFIITNWIIRSAKQQLDPANPQSSLQRNIIFRRKWSAFVIVMGIGNTALLAMIQLSIIYGLDFIWIGVSSIIFLALVVIMSIILTIRIGQGGSLVNLESTEELDQANLTEDRYWKLGQFYFNPDDSALFVEKRFGIGWTINMARPIAWLVFLVPIVVIIVISLLI